MDALTSILSDANKNQIFHYGVLFLLASLVHAREVRREIKAQIGILTQSINNVAEVLKKDLTAHGNRLDKLESDVSSIKRDLQK